MSPRPFLLAGAGTARSASEPVLPFRWRCQRPAVRTFAACQPADGSDMSTASRNKPAMRPLHIVWQRLVHEGATCPRCGSTGDNVARAVATLHDALRPLRIQPVLEVRAIDDAAFRASPDESNRITIEGRPLEGWLAGQTGSSPCCDVCGDLPCRTVEVGGRSFETIPETLIVRAALLAAAQLPEAVDPDKPARTGPGACCGNP